MEGYRAFANKLWNAARFVLMNLRGNEDRFRIRQNELSIVDRWILDGLHRVTRTVNEALDQYRFDQAASALYQFIWHQFCDWYIELVKPCLTGPESESRNAARSRAVLVKVLDSVLRLLHPFMPFITEDLWQRLPHRGKSLAAADYPVAKGTRPHARAARDMERVLEIISCVRHVRAESNIDPGRRIHLLLRTRSRSRRTLLEGSRESIRHLARCENVQIVTTLKATGPAARGVAQDVEFAIPLEGMLDLDAEQRRLKREIDRLSEDMEVQQRKLSNPSFISKAPATVVGKTRTDFEAMNEKKSRLEETLRQIGLN
jgi:valyl-tRNA synthetase